MVSGAILAGGRASRFGGIDKGALIVDGRSILDRQLAELSALTDDVLIIGGPARAQAARSVADRVTESGPLGGLYTAVAEARGDQTIVVACDMPYVTAALLRHLVDLAGEEVDAVVPRTDRGWHPLCAVYKRQCLAPMSRRLGDGRLKLSDLLADLRVRAVDPQEIDRHGHHEQLLANLNTPGEYCDVAALHAHGR
jgi:molybdopterin-guanine dinucleotide biosynthesis protein A